MGAPVHITGILCPVANRTQFNIFLIQGNACPRTHFGTLADPADFPENILNGRFNIFSRGDNGKKIYAETAAVLFSKMRSQTVREPAQQMVPLIKTEFPVVILHSVQIEKNNCGTAFLQPHRFASGIRNFQKTGHVRQSGQIVKIDFAAECFLNEGSAVGPVQDTFIFLRFRNIFPFIRIPDNRKTDIRFRINMLTAGMDDMPFILYFRPENHIVITAFHSETECFILDPGGIFRMRIAIQIIVHQEIAFIPFQVKEFQESLRQHECDNTFINKLINREWDGRMFHQSLFGQGVLIFFHKGHTFEFRRNKERKGQTCSAAGSPYDH